MIKVVTRTISLIVALISGTIAFWGFKELGDAVWLFLIPAVICLIIFILTWKIKSNQLNWLFIIVSVISFAAIIWFLTGIAKLFGAFGFGI